MAYIPNLRWTVGDMDRLEIARKWRHKTADEIVGVIGRTHPHLICSPDRIKEICQHFRVPLAGERRAS